MSKAREIADQNAILVRGKIPNISANTIPDLLAVDTAKFQSVNLLGYHEKGDGGGGVFYWDANEDKANHNGGTIIDPIKTFPTDWNDTSQQDSWFNTTNTGNGCWKRVYDGTVNVDWFGAKGDESTDDTIALQKSLTDFQSIISDKNRTYYITQIIIKGNNKNISLGNLLVKTNVLIGQGNSFQYSSFVCGNITGTDNTTSIGLEINYSLLSNIKVNKISNCYKGIELTQTNSNDRYISNYIYAKEIRECSYGIHFKENAYNNQCEGTIIDGKQIVGNTTQYGVLFDANVASGGCYFYISAIDIINGYSYVNNMDYTKTSGNIIFSYINDNVPDKTNIFMNTDILLDMKDGSFLSSGHLKISGNDAYSLYYIMPNQTRGTGTNYPDETDNGIHSKGIRIAGDSIRSNGGQIILGGGTNTTYPATINLLTPNSGNTETERLIIKGKSDVAYIQIKNSILATGDATDSAFNGVSSSDGVVISSDSAGLPNTVSIQRGNGNNLYLSKPNGYTNGSLISFRVNGTIVGGISTDGNSTTYATSSDYRLKEDLKEITNALALINKIKIYDFKYKKSGKRDIGVIAHELQEIVPQAVTGEKDGKEYQAVDYSRIVPLLIKAIQEISNKLNI